jgi:hypothetical protein
MKINNDYEKQLCLDCQHHTYNVKVCKFARIVSSLALSGTTDGKPVYSCMNFEPKNGWNNDK